MCSLLNKTLVSDTRLAKINPRGTSRPRAFVMPDWIAQANIDHFKQLLQTEKDPQKRAMIERELAEEEVKLAALLKKQGPDKKEG